MYVLYGSNQSLFTRKLEAALIFHGAPFEFRLKRGRPDVQEIERRAGTHQVPVLLTPEGWMLADTTPIIDLLDQRFPDRRLFPEGPLGVLAQIVEEYLDEWVARTMVHYRWHYPASAEFASRAIAGGDEAAAEFIRGWGPRACRATGTETPFHQAAAEAEYDRLLAAANAQLAQTRYLLGDRPSVVDCMMLGGFRAHTLHDPDPRKVVERFPRLVAWAEREADAWDGTGSWETFPQSTAFARNVLAEAAAHYAPFLAANARALEAGAKAFTVETHGEPASYLTRDYPERSRGFIRERISRRLLGRERLEVDHWLQGQGLAEAFAPQSKT
ncbi:glutathione S-transferase family protein [Phenylobacterium sp.]|uniref:glutathione S-transferase family protein n=1 Tax=Phenylobacterium sp. TaxID=1871053 RepID=UPI00121E8DF8|nr:glutathione S-transferase family protein [Phenylobacterium sp.]THD59901.1 MAG: glutathione S-transferase family protein [Phenylobacterium sp.]